MKGIISEPAELLAETTENEPSLSDVVMLVDLKKCIGCFSCEVSCKLEHNTGFGPRFIRLMQVGPKRVNGRLKTLYVPMLCMHCDPAACIETCPTGAMTKRAKDGIVYVDSEKCIGCKRCMQACPYGAVQWDSTKNIVVKCDFCKDRVDYRRVYSKEEIERIYRFALEKGRTLKEIIYDETGALKRDNKGRLVDAKGRGISGKDLVEKRKKIGSLEYQGLWSACATKCSTDCMKFGYYRDLRGLIDEMKDRRDIKRVGSIFYALPKDDFPYPVKRD